MTSLDVELIGGIQKPPTCFLAVSRWGFVSALSTRTPRVADVVWYPHPQRGIFKSKIGERNGHARKTV